jgi:hypothetical protein
MMRRMSTQNYDDAMEQCRRSGERRFRVAGGPGLARLRPTRERHSPRSRAPCADSRGNATATRGDEKQGDRTQAAYGQRPLEGDHSFVEANHAAYTDRAYRGIAGMSMGRARH